MEDDTIRNEQSQHAPAPEKWYAPLTRVTPLSKYLALALFVALPFAGFWLGVEYGKAAAVDAEFPLAPTMVTRTGVEISNINVASSSNTTTVLGKKSVYRQSEAMELLHELLDNSFFASRRSEEREYQIQCRYISDYVRAVTGACANEDQGEITYDRNCTNCSSNVDFKANEWAKSVVLLAEAEDERLALLEDIRIVLNQVLETRRQSAGYDLTSAGYIESLIRIKETFDQMEDAWLQQRDLMCAVQRDVIPPEVSGTNDLYGFEYRACLTYVTQQHVDYLRTIASWLSEG